MRLPTRYDSLVLAYCARKMGCDSPGPPTASKCSQTFRVPKNFSKISSGSVVNRYLPMRLPSFRTPSFNFCSPCWSQICFFSPVQKLAYYHGGRRTPMLPQRSAGMQDWGFHAVGQGDQPMPPRDTWRKFGVWLRPVALPRFCSSPPRFSATNCSLIQLIIMGFELEEHWKNIGSELITLPKSYDLCKKHGKEIALITLNTSPVKYRTDHKPPAPLLRNLSRSVLSLYLPTTCQVSIQVVHHVEIIIITIIPSIHQSKGKQLQLMELLWLEVPAQVTLSLRTLYFLTSEERLDSLQVEVHHDLAEVGVLDHSEQVTVNETHICLVVVMSVSPTDILHFVLVYEVTITVVDVLVLYEILVCQNEKRALQLLGELGCAEGEKPGVEQYYVGNFLLKFSLETVVGLQDSSTSIGMTHQNDTALTQLQNRLVKLCSPCLYFFFPESLDLLQGRKTSKAGIVTVLHCSHFILHPCQIHKKGRVVEGGTSSSMTEGNTRVGQQFCSLSHMQQLMIGV